MKFVPDVEIEYLNAFWGNLIGRHSFNNIKLRLHMPLKVGCICLLKLLLLSFISYRFLLTEHFVNMYSIMDRIAK